MVNASGVQLDVSISARYEGFDNTWNAVWESAVQIHSEGGLRKLRYHSMFFNQR